MNIGLTDVLKFVLKPNRCGRKDSLADGLVIGAIFFFSFSRFRFIVDGLNFGKGNELQ